MVCWMGFNGGSTLGFTGGNAELSVKVCVNTLFAGLTASLTALLMSKWIFGKVSKWKLKKYGFYSYLNKILFI